MEYFKADLQKINELRLQLEDEVDEEYKKCEEKLKELYSKAVKLFKTPETVLPVYQNNKRPKRIPDLTEEDEEELEAEIAEIQSQNTQKKVSNLNKSKAKQPTKENKENDPEPEQELEPEPEPIMSELRPVRTAKAKATSNLKEIPLNTKMRNDSNAVKVKVEKADNVEKPVSLASKKRTDEGISSMASGSETEMTAAKKVKRSDSLEIINPKTIQIDLVDSDEDTEKMPPPALPAPKMPKRTRTKKKVSTSSTDSSVSNASNVAPIPLRITRSKIKTEPVDKFVAPAPVAGSSNESSISDVSKVTENQDKPKRRARTKRNVPVPIKQEKISNVGVAAEPENNNKKTNKKKEAEKSVEEEPEQAVLIAQKPASPAHSEASEYEDAIPTIQAQQQATVNSPHLEGTFVVNETFSVCPPANSTHIINNDTIVLEAHHRNESIMTEDLDDDLPISKVPVIPPKPLNFKPMMLGATKKNEVFNPYVQSPVKKKVEAFEKHGKELTKSASASSLLTKCTTPSSSRIAMLQASKTTPQGSSLTMPKAASALKAKPLKKLAGSTKSLNQETLDDLKKKATVQDERKRMNEEKQRLAKLQREQLEKEKKEQAERVLKEREAKLQKLKLEREERAKMELMKKKLQKEKQEKKLAEERKKGEEDTSLYIKMQKQMMCQKAEAEIREQAKNLYCFDMLMTDDSTDDESKPASRRPAVPAWSKKPARKESIRQQVFTHTGIIDAMFSIQPMTVDLREIFPKIDSRKLARNSSAVWRTPPRYSQMPKF